MFVQVNQTEMSHKFIQVGNSKALIIPAKMVRRRGYDCNTEFDIIETSDGFKVVHKLPSLSSLTFPKVSKISVSEKVRNLSGIVSFSEEEVLSDERLKYLLER